MRSRRPLALAALLVVVLVLLAIVFRHALGRWTIVAVIGLASNSHASLADYHIGGQAAELRGLRLERHGLPLLTVDSLAVRYHLRDLLPGGERRYGLVAIEVNRPSIVLHRAADGSLDIGGPGGTKPATAATPPPPPTPLRLTVRVRDGRAELVDLSRNDPVSRHFIIDRLRFDATIDTGARSRYRFAGAYEPQGVRYPFTGGGISDVARGYAMNQVRAAAIPLREIGNYFINDGRIASLQAGSVRNIHFQYYSLTPNGRMHLAGSAHLDGLRLAVTALRYPLQDLSGDVQGFDDGIAATQIAAKIGETPIRLVGGLFHFADPQLRLGALASGPLPQLRTIFEFSRKQPIGGHLALRMLVEGPIGEPLILSRVRSDDMAYRAVPMNGMRATVAYYRSAVTVAPLNVGFGGIKVQVHGTIGIGLHTTTEAAAWADTRAADVPYAAQSVPNAQIHVTGLVSGSDAAFAARGVLEGAGGGDSLHGLFAVDALGDGELGPMLATHADGSSAAGGLILNRSRSQSAVWIDARNFRMFAPHRPPLLPGLAQITPPAFSGVFDGSISGIGPPSRFALAGTVRGHDVDVGGGTVHIDRLAAQIFGSPSDARMKAVTAQGPWGTFSGAAALDARRFGVRGDYRGSFARLERFTGKIGASGPVAANVAMLVAGGTTVVQTAHAATPGAAIRGIPLDDLSGTLAASPRGVRIYAGRGRVAGAPLAAGGIIGSGGGLGLAVADADASKMSGIDVPVSSGRLSALGTASIAASGLQFAGGALLRTGKYRNLPLDGNGDVRFTGSEARFDRVDGHVATLYASSAGSVAGIGRPQTRYDLALRLRAADVGDAAALFGVQRYYLDGSADADLHLSGVGAAPTISGRVVLPEATVNGLFIDHAEGDVQAAINARGARNIQSALTSVAISAGNATIGSTQARFSGEYQPQGAAALRLQTDRADLSDFNGFFDPGDLLAGSGRAFLDFSRAEKGSRTAGDVALQGLRIAHYDLGAASGRWTSSGSRVTGTAGFAGRLGNLNARGAVDLSGGRMLRMLSRSRFDLRVHASGVDLGAWLPALGYDFPVGGRIDANGSLRGRFPGLALAGTATLTSGTIGKLPVDRVSISASSSVSRTTITDASIDVASIAVRGSGSFGYAASAPLNLRLHATSPDIGLAVSKLTGSKVPLRGSLEADLRADGPIARPNLSAGFDVENGALAGVKLTRVIGELGVSGPDIQVRDVEVAFATGTLYLAGAIPLRLMPLGFGPPQAPITLEAAPKGIDLSDFEPLMPRGSRIRGLLDGRVAIRGTVASPQLDGRLTLANGELTATGFEQQPLRNIAGSLAFAGTGVNLERLHADAGPGSIDLQANASVANLQRIGGDATYDARVRFDRAFLDLPAYGKGQIDGSLRMSHVPGALATVSGKVSVDDAVIPFSALYRPGTGSNAYALSPGTTPAGLPNVAFDLDLSAGRSVRVRSSVIDIGGAGTIHAGGSLASPELAGSLESTGGTLTYFNTVFRLVEGVVTFVPGDGIVPVLDARASTHVINPDPNLERNLTGTADITLTVKGPVTNLAIGLESDPAYDREQILGLLLSAPAIGARSLFNVQANPGEPPPLSIAGAQTGTITVGQTAFAVLNAQFTRNLLAPIENSLGGALGLSNVNFTFDYSGSVGVSARKLLGKNLYAVYGATLGYPYRQSWGFELRPSRSTAAQFTFFQTVGVVYGYYTTPLTGAVSRETLNLPIAGQSGFSFSLQKFLW